MPTPQPTDQEAFSQTMDQSITGQQLIQQPVTQDVFSQTMAQPIPEQQAIQQPDQFNQDDIILVGSPAPNQEKTKKLIIAVFSALVVIALAAILIIALLPKDNKISLERVRSFCNNHNLTVTEADAETFGQGGAAGLECKSSNNEDDSDLKISFVQYEDSDNVSLNISSIILNGGTKLDDSDNYKKYYGGFGNNIYYMICSDASCILVMSSNDNDARQAIVDLGYPNRNWPTEEEQQSSHSDSSLTKAQRDTVRRNDMSRLDTSLVQYQTNHGNQSNNLPNVEVPSVWQAPTDGTFGPNGCGINVACQFVRDYMNTGSFENDGKENSFKDPDGIPYSLVITPNWSEGVITAGASNDTSKLDVGESMNGEQTYTIKDNGGDAFDAHTIYVIPGGRCIGSGVTASTKRHFAIMYRLESSGIYCIDDQ